MPDTEARTLQLVTRPDVTIAHSHPLFALIAHYDTAAAQMATDLAHRADRLATTMTRLAGNARASVTGQPRHMINGHGEVQDQGHQVDLLCARLAAVEEALTVLLATDVAADSAAPRT